VVPYVGSTWFGERESVSERERERGRERERKRERERGREREGARYTPIHISQARLFHILSPHTEHRVFGSQVVSVS
jgi:hypothetical protein